MLCAGFRERAHPSILLAEGDQILELAHIEAAEPVFAGADDLLGQVVTLAGKSTNVGGQIVQPLIGSTFPRAFVAGLVTQPFTGARRRSIIMERRNWMES